MANPLAILGSIAAGLTTVGAGGASGLFEGEVGGEHLKRQYASQELDNQLRVLQMIAQGQHLQKLNQPTYQFHGDRMFTLPPSGGQPIATELAPTARGEASMNLANQRADTADARRLLAEQKLQQKSPLETYMDYLRAGDKEGAAAYLNQYRAFKEAEHVQKPASEPKSLDSLLAKANDPTMPADERARAKQQADAIKQSHMDIQRAGAETRDDFAERRDERKADIKKREQQEKSGKNFAATETLLNQLYALIPAMKQKGFLASSDSSIAAAFASARRSRYVPMVGKPGDPDLTAWRAHAGTMVAILRQLGDIGPRAISAYQSAIDVIEHPTTAAGAKKAFDQLREALKAAKTGEVQGGTGGTPTMRFNPATGRLEPAQ